MTDVNTLLVQCQLFCTRRQYRDFVLWTERDIHIERIFSDEQFWLEQVARVKDFFSMSVLPELLEKLYSRTDEYNRPGSLLQCIIGRCN